MSAAVITPAIVTVDEAHAALHMAVAVKWPVAREARHEIFSAVLVLGCALRDCQERGGSEEAAGRVAHAGDHLIDVMTRRCGPGWGDA